MISVKIFKHKPVSNGFFSTSMNWLYDLAATALMRGREDICLESLLNIGGFVRLIRRPGS